MNEQALTDKGNENGKNKTCDSNYERNNFHSDSGAGGRSDDLGEGGSPGNGCERLKDGFETSPAHAPPFSY